MNQVSTDKALVVAYSFTLRAYGLSTAHTENTIYKYIYIYISWMPENNTTTVKLALLKWFSKLVILITQRMRWRYCDSWKLKSCGAPSGCLFGEDWEEGSSGGYKSHPLTKKYTQFRNSKTSKSKKYTHIMFLLLFAYLHFYNTCMVGGREWWYKLMPKIIFIKIGTYGFKFLSVNDHMWICL